MCVFVFLLSSFRFLLLISFLFVLFLLSYISVDMRYMWNSESICCSAWFFFICIVVVAHIYPYLWAWQTQCYAVCAIRLFFFTWFYSTCFFPLSLSPHLLSLFCSFHLHIIYIHVYLHCCCCFCLEKSVFARSCLVYERDWDDSVTVVGYVVFLLFLNVFHPSPLPVPPSLISHGSIGKGARTKCTTYKRWADGRYEDDEYEFY